MKLLTAVVLFAAAASAQDTPANPLVTVSKNIFAISKNDVLGSVAKIPDDLWSYQPTKDVRTVAQLFAHIADAQYEFCGLITEGKSVSKDIEKTKKTKAEIVPALNDAFAYCESAYASMTDADAAQLVSFFRSEERRVGAMDRSEEHTSELQ